MRVTLGFLTAIAASGLGGETAPEADRLPPPVAEEVEFSRDVRPILDRACVRCHGPEKARSDLRLDARDLALEGGQGGVAIIPGDGAGSPLVLRVAGLLPGREMPPPGKGDPLTPREIAVVRTWIDRGASWPAESSSEAPAAPAARKGDLWSLRPLVRPPVPTASRPDLVIRNPIDAFILAKLEENGLSPSPEADRRTLIRRLSFDLIGLPPTRDEVEAFVADPDPLAYERLVDRLLDSPRYGERWARHWLDVVHYGDSHGYDKDKPRPNAWPYRDYVIRALNEDRPWARFIEEQVAGDVLHPDTRDGIEALGFIAAGPWDLIGHEEVPETKVDGMIARHLDRDDMVANTIQSFESLTVQCAQCHDHKFDPIPQEDYYSLQAVFAAVDRTDRTYDLDPAVGRRRAALSDAIRRLGERGKALDDGILARAGQPVRELDERIAVLEKAGTKGEAHGYHSAIAPGPDATKWVQVDLGRPRELAAVILHACKDDFNGIGEGFGFPVRFKVEASDDPEFRTGVATLGDRTAEDVPNPRLEAVTVAAGGRAARFLRVTAVRLAPRQNDWIFALAELSALSPAGEDVAAGAAVTALDSIEAPVRWRMSNLTDGWYPGGPDVEPGELQAVRTRRREALDRATLPDERPVLQRLEADLSQAKGELAALPPQSIAYIGAVHRGAGAFAGTGGSGGQPRPIHILPRGDVSRPGREVGPGALSAVAELPARFALPSDHPEGDRRAALARWLVDPRNPLTWRSVVNRVWQHHFGRGIVETPNDFGHMGSPPSHPELLDWLAAEFRDRGMSLKRLHRLMVSSATYRQVSSAIPGGKDPENVFLGRMSRRKLDAEAVRDSILQVSGKLDLRMGGPAFRDFVLDKPDHSPHYEYRLHDPDDPATHRRSIYRFIVRSQPQPFMAALDCADPAMLVGRRNESVSPLQALALLNDSLVLAMAKHFAARLEREGGELPDVVARAFGDAIGRPPTASEREGLVAYARAHGLPNLCRVLYNLNEFSFVD